MGWLLLFMTVLVLDGPAWAKGSITIKDTKVKGHHVLLAIEHQRVAPSDQVHVFIDGAFVRAVAGQNIISVDLKPGKSAYSIELRNATRDFELLGACSRLDVTIPSTATGGHVTKQGVCEP